MHGRMFLGMEDGAIIMLPALQKLAVQFFIGKKPSGNTKPLVLLTGCFLSLSLSSLSAFPEKKQCRCVDEKPS